MRGDTSGSKGRGLGLWLVLAFVLIAGCSPGEPARKAASDSFYFVQVSDPHWGARDGVSLTRRVVEMVNTLPVEVEFVVVTGDLFSDSIRNEKVVMDGLEAMRGLKRPVFYVPGNHDIVKADIAGTTKLFERYFGPLNRATEIKGVLCLFLSTELGEGESRSPGQVQRDWLAQQMDSVKRRKPVLIFMHRPPIRDLLNGSDGEVSWDEPYDLRWEELFVRHPEVKAVFAGHFHRDEVEWIGDVPVYVAGALARFWDRQPSFRLYRYQAGRVNYWELYPPVEKRKRSGDGFSK